jgi:hypothetical protein
MEGNTTIQPPPDQQDVATDQLEQDEVTEDERVVAWRLERFVELGVESPMAEMLAADLNLNTRVDWHEVANLLNHGCPVGLAVEIVR